MNILLILLFFFVVVCLIKLLLRPRNFPPGPRGWPLLGYSPLIPKNVPLYIISRNMAKVYGPVTGFFLGPVQPFISVVGLKAIREALLNDDLNGKPSTAMILSRTYGEKLGLIFTEGNTWQEQRRFALRHLRDLGFGKTSVEDQIIDEIRDMILDIKNTSQSHPKNVVDFSSLFTISISNTLWSIIGNRRYQRNDQSFKNLLNCIGQLSQGVNTVQAAIPLPAFLINRIPWLPKLLGVDMDIFKPVQKFVEDAIEEHIATRSENDGARDFIDVYLSKMEEETKKCSSTFSKKQLVAVVMDLFSAGTETVSNTIGFAILYMIHFQDVQQKMQTELDNVCGESLPSLIHRPSLPYSEAFLMEVTRHLTSSPLIFHRAVRDTKLQGFTIPQGSILSISLDSAFHDPEVWGDPENFRPERHLDADGNIIKNDTLTPFGIGKRICLGEPLAKNTVFLFLAALVQSFEFKPTPGQPLPTFNPISGFTQGPKPYQAVVVPRIL